MTTQTPTDDRPTDRVTDATRADATEPGAISRLSAIGDAVAGAATSARDGTAAAATRLPEVADAAREAVAAADRSLDRASDQARMVASAVSFGIAAGLLVGGANRLLVLVALLVGAAPLLAKVRQMEDGAAARKVQRA